MKVGNLYIQSFKNSKIMYTFFARHLPKTSVVKLMRDPISVGIDPVREFLSVFCGVKNTIEVVSDHIVSLRDESWQSSQSIF
jgi:hypothetical protein